MAGHKIGKVCIGCGNCGTTIPVIDLESEMGGSCNVQVFDPNAPNYNEEDPVNDPNCEPDWEGTINLNELSQCNTSMHVRVGWAANEPDIEHNFHVWLA